MHDTDDGPGKQIPFSLKNPRSIQLTLVVVSITTLTIGAIAMRLSDKPEEARAFEESKEKTLSIDEFELLSSNTSNTEYSLGGPRIDAENGVLIPYPATTFEGVEVEAVQETSNEIRTYVVQEGDTISTIAEEFGVSANTIRWSNSIRSDKGLQVGQELVILPITGVRHTVGKGDTLSTIAEEYGASIEEIKDYNGIDDISHIAIGDELIIPDGEITPARQIASTPTPKSTPPSSGTHSTPSNSNYLHPVPGALVTQGAHGHNGIDFGAPTGTSIRAAASGEVIVVRSGWNGGYGNYIVIEHNNGTQTLYSHNSANYVSQGDWVEAGEIIGAVGSSGRSTGPHLHFEVRGASNPFAACAVMSRCGS